MQRHEHTAASSKSRHAPSSASSLAELARSSSLPQMTKSKATPAERSQMSGTPREKSLDVLGNPSALTCRSPTDGDPSLLKRLSMSEFLKSFSDEGVASQDSWRYEVLNQLQDCATRVSLLETSQAQLARDLCLSSEHLDEVESRLQQQIALVGRSVKDWGAFCQAERVLRESAIAKHEALILEVQQQVEQGADSALRTLDERLRLVVSRLEDAPSDLARPSEEVTALVKELSSQVVSLRAAMDEANTHTVDIERRCGFLESSISENASEVERSIVSALVADVKMVSSQLADHLETTSRIDELEARIQGCMDQLAAGLGSQRVDFQRKLADLEPLIIDSVRTAIFKDLTENKTLEKLFSEFVPTQTKDRRDLESKSKTRMFGMLGNGSASTKAPSADEPWHEEDDPPTLLRSANDRSCPLLPSAQASSFSPSRSLSTSNMMVVQGLGESKSARSLSIWMPEAKGDPPIVSRSARRENFRHTLPVFRQEVPGGFQPSPGPPSARVPHSPRGMRCGVPQTHPLQHMRRMAPIPSSPPLPTRQPLQ